MNADLIVRYIETGFLAVDTAWVVRTANPKASSMLRRTTQDIQGQLLWNAFPGVMDTNAERELRASAAGRAERRFEFFSPSLYNWFDIRAVPDEEGGLYVFFQDVTDRARAMQTDAVRETVRRILMDAPVAISITRGPEHRFEMLNAAARALVGRRDLEGSAARIAMPEVDESLFTLLDTVYQSGTPMTVADLVVTYDRDGTGQLYTGTFDMTYQPVRGTDGAVEGIIQTAVETTTFSAARKLAAGSAA